jgi:hypothetical protein
VAHEGTKTKNDTSVRRSTPARISNVVFQTLTRIYVCLWQPPGPFRCRAHICVVVWRRPPSTTPRWLLACWLRTQRMQQSKYQLRPLSAGHRRPPEGADGEPHVAVRRDAHGRRRQALRVPERAALYRRADSRIAPIDSRPHRSFLRLLAAQRRYSEARRGRDRSIAFFGTVELTQK